MGLPRAESLRPRRPRRVPRLGAQADALELRPGIERMDEAAEYSGGHSLSRLRRRRRQALLDRRLHNRPTATGLPAWVPSKSVWIYDINAKSWSKGPTCRHRGALSATAVGTKIYAIGGAKNPSYSTPELRPSVPVENVATNEVLDIGTNSWSPPAPMLTARNHHGARSSTEGSTWSAAGSARHSSSACRTTSAPTRCTMWQRTPGHPSSACRLHGAGSGSPC